MTIERQMRFWLGGILIGLALLYVFQAVLLPFIVGMGAAYLLDPAADRLEKWGASRLLATALITIVFFAAIIVALMVLTPLLNKQVVDLVASLPAYVEALRGWLEPMIERLRIRLPADQLAQIKEGAGGFVGDAVKWIAGLLGALLRGGAALFNLMSLIFITPLVTFYLLRDWDRIVARVDSWLPRAQAPVIREQARRVDETLAGFVRGVLGVCLILATFYGLALSLIGLKSGLIIGIIAGLLSFIPFFGALIGFVAAVGMALIQFSDWGLIALTASVFVIGQIAEGNFLTPKLVGKRVGLHPLWVIFALLAGGAVFGFVGILLAVPAAAVMGVLLRFGIGRYLDSPLYHGDRADGDGRRGS